MMALCVLGFFSLVACRLQLTSTRTLAPLGVRWISVGIYGGSLETVAMRIFGGLMGIPLAWRPDTQL